VAFTAPVPRPPHRLLGDVTTAERRSHAILGLARSTAVSLRLQPSHQSSLRSTRSLTFYRQTPRRLGPRSLVPPRFLARCVRAYSRPGCCLPTSATAYDVRTKRSGALVFLAGTMAMTTFLFLRLTHDPFELPRTAVGRGEPRIRPSDRDPGAGSSWLPRFARPRYLDHRDTSRELPRESSVPIDVHGSLDRAKDVSSSAFAFVNRFLGASRESAHALRTLTTFPSSFFQRTPVVAGAIECMGTSPAHSRRTDLGSRSSDSPRRLPASREPGCLPPLQRRARERIAPLRFPCRPPAHAAHTLPPWLGTMCLSGLARLTIRFHEPASVLFALRESRTPLQPVVTPAFTCAFSAPGSDDPSAPTWLGRCGQP